MQILAWKTVRPFGTSGLEWIAPDSMSGACGTCGTPAAIPAVNGKRTTSPSTIWDSGFSPCVMVSVPRLESADVAGPRGLVQSDAEG